MADAKQAARSGAPVVRIQGLTKLYGETPAVNNITFDVQEGELLTLLGPSGCGKTTTMRSIAGLEKINGGEIYLNGKVMSSVPQRVHLSPEKRDVGMVFQSYAIWPHMTVFENVAYPLRCRRVEKSEILRRVSDELKLVEMEAYEQRPATQLSGGQQQRVALARSMVMEPSVLLLDEPLSNLDAKLRGQMRTHIKELQRITGLTMIYVTHDQVEAMAISDRIIVMNKGVIEQVGLPEEVYERPQSEFVADFVGAINFIWGKVVGIKVEHNLLHVSVGDETLACALDGNAGVAVDDRILLMIRPEKINVRAANGAFNDRDDEVTPVNRVKGQVAVNTYCGDHRELSITAKNFSVKVMAPNGVTGENGEAVEVVFAAQDVHFLPQGAGSGKSAGDHGDILFEPPRA
jgi:iron(III) transport system ATP-binding protein